MIILSGSHTLLGGALLPLLRDSYQVCAFDDERGDIKDRAFVAKLCGELSPAVFINCAQMDNIEECEYKREDAYTVNGKVPAMLAEICAERKIVLVQISSHYVFNGEGDLPFREDSPVKPGTVYGDSKNYADQKIAASGAEYLIVRFPHLYGKDGGFIASYMGKMKTGETIPFISDQVVSPTYVQDAAQMLLELLKRNVRGIIHCANDGVTPLSGFLYEVEKAYSRASGKGLVVKMQGFAPDDYLSPCDLPVNNTLDVSRLKKETGIMPRHWKDALDDFIASNYQYL